MTTSVKQFLFVMVEETVRNRWFRDREGTAAELRTRLEVVFRGRTFQRKNIVNQVYCYLTTLCQNRVARLLCPGLGLALYKQWRSCIYFTYFLTIPHQTKLISIALLYPDLVLARSVCKNIPWWSSIQHKQVQLLVLIQRNISELIYIKNLTRRNGCLTGHRIETSTLSSFIVSYS